MNPADLYPSEVIAEVRDAIRLGPVVLAGPPGSGREAVARAALRVWSLGLRSSSTPARAGTMPALEVDFARDLVAALTDDSEPDFSSGLPPAQLRALQRRAGSEASALLATARGEGGAGLDTLLGLVEPPMAVVVRDAIQLKRRWAHNALWTIRGRAAEDDAPRIVLLARAHHELADRTDALFGAATTYKLRPPSAAHVAATLSLDAAMPDWMAASRRLPAVVGAAQAIGDGDIEAGWRELVASASQRRATYRRPGARCASARPPAARSHRRRPPALRQHSRSSTGADLERPGRPPRGRPDHTSRPATVGDRRPRPSRCSRLRPERRLVAPQRAPGSSRRRW